MKKFKIDRNLVRISAANSLVVRRLDELYDLAELSERLLNNELEALLIRVKERVSTLAFPESKFEQDWYSDDFYRLSEIFPRIQRYALFTATMSAIEHCLKCMYKVAQQVCNQSVSLEDSKGDDFASLLSYLIKKCDLKISQETGSEVYDLKMYQKIRNAIIHMDGRPKGNKLQAIKDYQKKNQMFQLTDHDEIVLSAMITPTVICRAGELFEIIVGEIKKKVKAATSPPVG